MGVGVWVARTCAAACLTAMLVWEEGYLGGFAFGPVDTTKAGGAPSNSTAALFNWHPLLMVLAFVVCMTEGVHAYSSIAASKRTRKSLHFWLHTAAVVCISGGLAAVFRAHALSLPHPKPDLYSAHAIAGLAACVAVYAQYVAGFYAFWAQRVPEGGRRRIAPLHAIAGACIYACGLVVLLMGVAEKTAFIQTGKHAGPVSLTGAKMRLPVAIALTVFPLLIVLLVQLAGHAHPRQEAAPLGALAELQEDGSTARSGHMGAALSPRIASAV